MTKLKLHLCDSCKNCTKTIEKRQVPIYARSTLTKTVTELSRFCNISNKRVRRYVLKCNHYINITLEAFT